MFIEKIEQNIIKINFYAKDEEVYAGELVKIVCSGQKGVIAQVIKIESPENNKNYNTASLKTLFSVESSGEIKDWMGNVPGNDFIVSKIKPHELWSITKTGKVPNPVLAAQLACCSEIAVNIEASFLEKPSLVVADKESQKNDLLDLLAFNLSQKNAKTILVDFNGEFSDNHDALKLKAGKDIKLPFDLDGLEYLYDKILSNVSSEIRANIENIFSEIEEYLNSGKVSFVPFKVFVDAVKEENQANSMPELELLSNQLSKLHKKGLFADEQKEIISLFGAFNDNSFIILDLSEISKEWKPLFIDFIIKLNKDKFKKKFFLLMDLDKYFIFNKADSVDVIEKIFNNGVKSGIKPVLSLKHQSELISIIGAEAENFFIFPPQNDSNLLKFQPFLGRINHSDLLISGKITNNVLLLVKLPIFEETRERIFAENYTNEPVKIQFDDNFTENSCFQECSNVLPKTKVEPLKEELNKISIKPVTTYEFDNYKSNIAETLEDEEFSEEELNSVLDYEETVEAGDEDEETLPAQSFGANQEFSEVELNSVLAYDENVEVDVEDEDEEILPAQSYGANQEFSEDELNSVLDYDENEGVKTDTEDEYEETLPAKSYGVSYDDENEEDNDIEDESAYYQSDEQFQDESVLDYAHTDEDDEDDEEFEDEIEEVQSGIKTVSSLSSQEFSDNDLKNFMDYEDEDDEEVEEEDAYYESDDQFQDESALDYAEEEQEEPKQKYIPQYPAASSNNEEFSEDDLSAFMDYDENEVTAKKSRPEPVKKVAQKPRPIKGGNKMPGPPTQSLPVYTVPGEDSDSDTDIDLSEGDRVRHKKYGIGVIKKVIGYSEKKLCSIQFDDVGRRLLDPRLAELEKI